MIILISIIIKEGEDTPEPDIDPEDDKRGSNSMEDNYIKAIEKLRMGIVMLLEYYQQKVREDANEKR